MLHRIPNHFELVVWLSQVHSYKEEHPDMDHGLFIKILQNHLKAEPSEVIINLIVETIRCHDRLLTWDECVSVLERNFASKNPKRDNREGMNNLSWTEGPLDAFVRLFSSVLMRCRAGGLFSAGSDSQLIAIDNFHKAIEHHHEATEALRIDMKTQAPWESIDLLLERAQLVYGKLAMSSAHHCGSQCGHSPESFEGGHNTKMRPSVVGGRCGGNNETQEGMSDPCSHLGARHQSYGVAQNHRGTKRSHNWSHSEGKRYHGKRLPNRCGGYPSKGSSQLGGGETVHGVPQKATEHGEQTRSLGYWLPKSILDKYYEGGWCTYCGQAGHKAKDCCASEPTLNPSLSPEEKASCYIKGSKVSYGSGLDTDSNPQLMSVSSHGADNTNSDEAGPSHVDIPYQPVSEAINAINDVQVPWPATVDLIPPSKGVQAGTKQAQFRKPTGNSSARLSARLQPKDHKSEHVDTKVRPEVLKLLQSLVPHKFTYEACTDVQGINRVLDTPRAHPADSFIGKDIRDRQH
jgi:hypothetical protein